MLQGKKIILGVTGSIAAYKAAILTRLLIKAEAEVKVILTTSASEFISPITLATLSKNPVLQHFVRNEEGVWNNHVELGLWADVLLIAPASANTLGKMSHGICDNLLTAVYLSARCPVFIAPAMDLDMHAHPSTITNLALLKQYGNHIIEAEEGELASGLSGMGRMAEPEHVLDNLVDFFNKKQQFIGKKVLITAGPTHEALDPVRYIGNHSTGKMGFLVAETFANQGADVTLVSGPSHCHLKNLKINLVQVKSAQEMYEACEKHFAGADISILAAAVADYRPKQVAAKKIKKSDPEFQLELVKTIDIAATLGQKKKSGQWVVGFALETDHEQENAFKKLQAKNLDLIVLNSLNDKGAGFGHDTNQVTFIDKHNNIQKNKLKDKQAVAADLANIIARLMYD